MGKKRQLFACWKSESEGSGKGEFFVIYPLHKDRGHGNMEASPPTTLY